MTKNPLSTENSKTNGQHKTATKNFDYTTIADRLRTVSWSNNSHQTGVIKPSLKGTNLPTHCKSGAFKRTWQDRNTAKYTNGLSQRWKNTEGYSKSIVRRNNDKFGKRIGLNE